MDFLSHGISIALAIHSFDPIQSLDRSGLLEAGAQGISIARAIRLVDRTLQMCFSNML